MEAWTVHDVSPGARVLASVPRRPSEREPALQELVEQLRSDHQNHATAKKENDKPLAVHNAMFAERSLAGDRSRLPPRLPES